MKRNIVMCVLALMLGSTCQADEHPFYIGVSGGLSLLQDVEDDGAGADFDAGGAFNTFLGWREGSGRIEFEYSKLNNSLDTAGGVPAESGNVDLNAYMMSGYLDLPITHAISVYGGGGLGVAQVHANSLGVFGDVAQATSDLGLAYQARVGATYSFTERAELFSGYRFLGSESLTVASSNLPSTTFSDQFYNHSIEFGLRFKF